MLFVFWCLAPHPRTPCNKITGGKKINQTSKLRYDISYQINVSLRGGNGTSRDQATSPPYLTEWWHVSAENGSPQSDEWGKNTQNPRVLRGVLADASRESDSRVWCHWRVPTGSEPNSSEPRDFMYGIDWNCFFTFSPKTCQHPGIHPFSTTPNIEVNACKCYTWSVWGRRISFTRRQVVRSQPCPPTSQRWVDEGRIHMT